MKTITGTIPLSVLEQISAADKAYVVEPEKQKFVGMSTRDNKTFQAYIAPLVNPNIIDAFNGHAPMPHEVATPQEEARSQPQQALEPAQLKAGDLVMCPLLTGDYAPRIFSCWHGERAATWYNRASMDAQGPVIAQHSYRLPTPAERAEFAPENDGWIEWDPANKTSPLKAGEHFQFKTTVSGDKIFPQSGEQRAVDGQNWHAITAYRLVQS